MNCQLDPEADLATLSALVRKGIAQADPPDVGLRDWQTICLAVRDAQGEVVGGLYGATMWSWLMIDGLWVDPGQRGRGVGRQLLLAAEEIALQRGCVGSLLNTFDFQAKVFYERNGYTVLAAMAGFPPGHTQFRLQKHLS